MDVFKQLLQAFLGYAVELLKLIPIMLFILSQDFLE